LAFKAGPDPGWAYKNRRGISGVHSAPAKGSRQITARAQKKKMKS